MQRTFASALVLCLCAGPGLAQDLDTEEFNGKWRVALQGSDNRTLAARVDIVHFGGTWTDLPQPGQPGDKVCRGKTFPVTVQASKPAGFEFTVWGSAVSPSCPDLSVSVKPIDDKTLEGTIGTDRKIKLMRIAKSK